MDVPYIERLGQWSYVLSRDQVLNRGQSELMPGLEPLHWVSLTAEVWAGGLA